MKHVVVFAHPRSGSFIRQAVGAYVDELEQCGHAVTVRDLYAMGFNPVLSEEELAGTGPVPEDIQREQDLITASQAVSFVFPIWWAGMPAMLKGYVDRVFSYGFAWEMRGEEVEGKLHGRKGLIVTSSGAPMAFLEATGERQAFTVTQDVAIMGLCGIRVVEHLHFDDLGPHTTPAQVDDDIRRIRAAVRNHF
ncbi:NAD(P)H-dependent oxidoreductase [Azospirillum sp. A1-3]|jgi:NAD(P)H dehydrogenase (quinone)|uniref:NAD(P)H-dependent oxidoreductase n=1 Tax=Azospirillum sp. A1-3 TaxID=185874 RepID=UPI00207729C0|nr:NAD(P)H-dependent oxidoreductase [Azospirillum sp. A1-3]MCM8736100.1 NAD(P)H-dependent oxidoreductase [Azospirillum sp. A1-3]